jgi:ribosomal protein S12 methylthiotransferase
MVSRDGAVGRSSADAPEIDGQVHVHAANKIALKNIKPGDIVRARVTDTNEHDLIAALIA